MYDQVLSKKPVSEGKNYTVGPSHLPLTKLPQVTHPRLWPSLGLRSHNRGQRPIIKITKTQLQDPKAPTTPCKLPIVLWSSFSLV